MKGRLKPTAEFPIPTSISVRHFRHFRQRWLTESKCNNYEIIHFSLYAFMTNEGLQRLITTVYQPCTFNSSTHEFVQYVGNARFQFNRL